MTEHGRGGFGVSDEAHLAEVLHAYGMSQSKASCVARVAFAVDQPTGVHPNGWFDVNQATLRAAGHERGIAWSDYDFTRD